MSDDESPELVAVRLDDLRQVLDAASSNPYLTDVPGSMDYLDRLEAIAAERTPFQIGPSSRYAVIRAAADLPEGFLPDGWDGRWIELTTDGPASLQPGLKYTVFGVEAFATDRFEERDDGAKARVFEVRSPIPESESASRLGNV